MSFVEIRINNWEKFHARKDIKRPWWFKLSNSILEDPDMHNLTPEEFKAWIYILCQSSKQTSEKVRIYHAHAKIATGLEKSAIDTCILKLNKIKVLSKIRTRSVRDPVGNLSDHVRQTRLEEIRLEKNNTYARNDVRAGVCFDFESLYALYPRKQGKSQGMKKLQSSIKNQEDFDNFKIAVEKYSQNCRTDGTDKQFIKHFSTFVSEWRDWLDPEHGTAVTMKKKTGLDLAMERIEAEYAPK